MMLLNDIKRIYGEDSLILFKGSEPFVEIKDNIPAGVLIENKDSKVLCYLCNEWFYQLGTHMRSHKKTIKEYKIEFGYNLSAPLCGKKFSKILSEKSTKEWQENREEKMEKIREIGLLKIGRPTGLKITYQRKNQLNTCEEQIKARMELLINKFGNDISIAEARTVDQGLVMYAMRHFDGWNSFKDKFGLLPDLSSKKKNRADLIYDLRNFVSSNKRIPWDRKSGRLLGFPHSRQAYITEFSSMKMAYNMCGIYISSPKNGFYSYKLKY